jgi:FkbM family methyltransferase
LKSLSSTRSFAKQAIARNLGPQALERVRSEVFLWRLFLGRGFEMEVQTLPKLVPPAACALDIGASRGLYTYHLSRLAREVHAFEPHVHSFNRLSTMVHRFRLTNVTLHNVALSDYHGEAGFVVPRMVGQSDEGWSHLAGADERVDCSVPVRRLDDCRFPQVSFIKCDVEGAELLVLRGGRNTITEHRPALLLETEDRHAGRYGFRAADVFEFMANLGYRAFRLRRDTLELVISPSAEVHNYVFLCRG